jgi:hypothetical protein
MGLFMLYFNVVGVQTSLLSFTLVLGLAVMSTLRPATHAALSQPQMPNKIIVLFTDKSGHTIGWSLSSTPMPFADDPFLASEICLSAAIEGDRETCRFQLAFVAACCLQQERE